MNPSHMEEPKPFRKKWSGGCFRICGIFPAEAFLRKGPVMRLLRTAYILLWFPKPSETFIFNEVTELARIGLPRSVYSFYGKFPDHLSPRMTGLPVPIRRLGIPSLGELSLISFTGSVIVVRV